MSVARSASATTSLPKPATLTPARTGRSSADKLPPPAGRTFAPSFVLLAKMLSPPFSARRAEGRHPTGLRDRLQSTQSRSSSGETQLLINSHIGAKERIAPGLPPSESYFVPLLFCVMFPPASTLPKALSITSAARSLVLNR